MHRKDQQWIIYIFIYFHFYKAVLYSMEPNTPEQTDLFFHASSPGFVHCIDSSKALAKWDYSTWDKTGGVTIFKL